MTICTVWTCCLAAVLSGADGEADGGPVNQLCPVMVEEPVDPRFTLEHEGRTIGFCCEKCVAKFRSNPERYRTRLAALLSTADDQSGGIAADDVLSAKDANTSTGTWVERLGRCHPLIVHFPIAATPLALIGMCVWLVTRRPAFAAADVPPLVVGGAASILAVVTGNMASWSASFSSSLQDYLLWHQYAGTLLMLMTLAICALRVWCWRRLSGVWLGLYAGSLAVATLIAALSGFLGGTLVFGPGHLWP